MKVTLELEPKKFDEIFGEALETWTELQRNYYQRYAFDVLTGELQDGFNAWDVEGERVPTLRDKMDEFNAASASKISWKTCRGNVMTLDASTLTVAYSGARHALVDNPSIGWIADWLKEIETNNLEDVKLLSYESTHPELAWHECMPRKYPLSMLLRAFDGSKKLFTIEDLSFVEKMTYMEISGDQVVTVKYKDGTVTEFDPMKGRRCISHYDTTPFVAWDPANDNYKIFDLVKTYSD